MASARRVPARGAPPRPAAQQGSHPGRDGLPPVTAYSPDPRDLGPEGPASRGRARPAQARAGRVREANRRRRARPRGPLLPLGRQPARGRPRRRRDPRRARRRHDGRGRPGRGVAPAHGARLADRRPDPRRHGRAPGPAGAARAPARGDARALPARRRPRRHPARARARSSTRSTPGSSVASTRRPAPTPKARPRTCGKMLRDVAARRLDQLDALPADVGERIRGLAGLRLPRAARARTVRRARQEAPGPGARPVRRPACPRRSRTMRPEDLAANREMVRDLNELHPPADRRRATRTRASSWPSTASSSRARRRSTTSSTSWPQRMAAMQSLMRSMSPEQRAELQLDDGGAPPRRPHPRRPRPARVEPRPAPAGRARRPGPVRRRGAARASKAPSRRSAGSRRWTGWRTRCPTSRRRPTWPRSIATRCATCSATTHCASSRPSTTSPAGSRRPAT